MFFSEVNKSSCHLVVERTDESFTQMDTCSSVQVRSRPTHPMSTTRSSLISFGSVAPPYPISSCVEKQIYVLCFGFMSLSFMIFKSVSSSAEQALSSMKRDFKNPLFVNVVLGS